MPLRCDVAIRVAGVNAAETDPSHVASLDMQMICMWGGCAGSQIELHSFFSTRSAAVRPRRRYHWSSIGAWAVCIASMRLPMWGSMVVEGPSSTTGCARRSGCPAAGGERSRMKLDRRFCIAPMMECSSCR